MPEPRTAPRDPFARGASPSRGGAFEEGLHVGRMQGRVEERARAVLRVFENRGVAVPAATQERILSCRYGNVLDHWFDRAFGLDSAEDLFDALGTARRAQLEADVREYAEQVTRHRTTERARFVLRALRNRRIPVSPATRQRIATADQADLTRLFDRAFHVDRADQLFDR